MKVEREKVKKKKKEKSEKSLTVTGPVDDSSLVAPRWHPAELRGGVRLLADGRCCRCRRSAQLEKFATDAVVVVIAGGRRDGGRSKERPRHLDETEEGQVLRTAFVQRFAGAL